VMDGAAIALARDNGLPVIVFSIDEPGNLLKVLRGDARADTDGRAGRKSLELILGIYESAKTGREVPIPLRTRL
jgi:hypothetical protein